MPRGDNSSRLEMSVIPSDCPRRNPEREEDMPLRFRFSSRRAHSSALAPPVVILQKQSTCSVALLLSTNARGAVRVLVLVPVPVLVVLVVVVAVVPVLVPIPEPVPVPVPVLVALATLLGISSSTILVPGFRI